MKLTILGCTGSLGAPKGPASGYLLRGTRGPAVIMDFGPGTLAALQEVQDPADAHVMFSHLHADHCMDFPSLMVWRRYHPASAAPARNLCCGPIDLPTRMGRLSSDIEGEVDDMSDSFAFVPWRHGEAQIVADFTVTPYSVVHPIEAYGLRVEEPATGRVLAYSGDTGWCENLIELARGADVFLCEATWGDESQGKPEAMHLSGQEAGRAARLAGVRALVLVHIPPWVDQDATVAAARTEFDGEILLGRAGMALSV
ncbi:MBL fold metallo-hydrolase [Corynebacterium sp. CCM 9185]|uniref:MBL fold metallo-hydrolase n=1 Tax=Corynebacterium marambiense TaxID=2765364 RepID=A0ABS0W1C9_9CORY|nr:MBL fold metallo-hydrolase [Corynebacterium marambiense]MBI9001407.1 MBL fold metallo-hydrolase [Corynebacterium marambiense]MCK7664067.1 MBL fold metallo-hydrolase [Corynebacterium marambiense]MCX7543404.1 MBL fold metallo-hydrolase [Corynebacterium marambiense]